MNVQAKTKKGVEGIEAEKTSAPEKVSMAPFANLWAEWKLDVDDVLFG